MAVQTCFMLSCFYMAQILTTKYVGPGSYRLFLSNRLLRIFPAYWVVLLASLVLCFLAEPVIGHSRLSVYRQHALMPGSWLILAGSNLLILGQDSLDGPILDRNGSSCLGVMADRTAARA
jgi:peptidoglycan/LPS O-acetylase OafA/YrhL